VHGERDLVHHSAVETGGVRGVLLAAALLQAGECPMLAGGVDERVTARVDLRLATAEIQRGRVLRVLGALDVGLHREQVRATGLRRGAAILASPCDAIGGGAQRLLTALVMGDARRQLLGRALLGTLAQGAHTLKAELEGTGAHVPVIGGAIPI
jgi:hypothetical protein